jgi:hypothetical protein
MTDLDAFEDALIDRFRGHPVLADTARLADADFAALLLQRRFVSLAFTPSYDLAIDLLSDEAGLRIARAILREEYPDGRGHTRSHREDMKEDLLQLGIPRADLVASRPTRATRNAIDEAFALISEAGGHDDADLRLLTFLRFWGEVLVRSRFYYPHYVHDAKAHPLTAVSLLSATHSDRLATRIGELLARHGSADAFRETEERALHLKTAFYDQFLPALDRTGAPQP